MSDPAGVLPADAGRFLSCLSLSSTSSEHLHVHVLAVRGVAWSSASDRTDQ